LGLSFLATETQISFQLERCTEDLLNDLRPLFKKHFDEVAPIKDFPLNPNYEAYLKFEEWGVLRIFTARKAGHVVGYAIFFVKESLHFKDLFEAVHDLLFIEKPHRKGMMGYRFIKWCDEQLKGEGVKMVFHHVPHTYDFSNLLKRLNYELVDFVYGRRLA
jgi:hypothetical protein